MDKDDCTMALYRAIRSNNLDKLRRLIEAGGDVNQNGRWIGLGHTPLCTAVSQNNLRAAQLLLEYVSDVALKCSSRDSHTALHTAIRDYGTNARNINDFCKLLLEAGANCNSRNHLDITPFHCALSNGDMEVVRLFLDHGADLTAIDNHGKTALHHAARNQDVDVVKFALEHGFDIYCNDKQDFSPLHYAVMRGRFEVCELLLRRGAAVNKTSKEGFTPMTLIMRPEAHFMEKLDRVRVLQVLLEYEAEVGVEVANRDKRVLELAVHDDQSIRDILMQHMARMHY